MATMNFAVSFRYPNRPYRSVHPADLYRNNAAANEQVDDGNDQNYESDQDKKPAANKQKAAELHHAAQAEATVPGTDTNVNHNEHAAQGHDPENEVAVEAHCPAYNAPARKKHRIEMPPLRRSSRHLNATRSTTSTPSNAFQPVRFQRVLASAAVQQDNPICPLERTASTEHLRR
jgi:hypothetical protein